MASRTSKGIAARANSTRQIKYRVTLVRRTLVSFLFKGVPSLRHTGPFYIDSSLYHRISRSTMDFRGNFCPCRKPGEKSEGKHCTNPDECAILCITVPAHRPETDVFCMLSGGGGPSRSCITGTHRRSTPSLRLPPLFHHGRRALLPGAGGDAGPPGGRMRPGFGAPIFRRTALGERAAPSHQILNF